MQNQKTSTRRSSSESRSRDEAYLDTLAKRMPQMQSLFEKLSRNEHPDFLAVMAAISEMVALYVDCDTETAQQVENIFLMSQKKCRFCD